jgi:hypothetical protein
MPVRIIEVKAAYLKVNADDDARNAKQQELESSVHGLHVALLGVGQPGKLENHARHRAVSIQPSHERTSSTKGGADLRPGVVGSSHELYPVGVEVLQHLSEEIEADVLLCSSKTWCAR